MKAFGEGNLEVNPPQIVGKANTFENTTRLDHIDNITLPVVDGIHHRSATADDFIDLVYLALKGYQAYWVPLTRLDPWLVYFPYAWYLEKDTRIFNRTTGAEYFIDKYEPKIGQNVVKLKSDSGLAPKEKDILEFDSTTGKVIHFQRAYPNSDDVNKYVTPEEIERNSVNGFIDTIAYKIRLIKPAVIDGTKQVKARKYGEEVNSETGFAEDIYMEQFDSEIQFQCWTNSMEGTAKLARWFRVFMRTYKDTFQLNGVQQIVFTQQSDEYNVTRWRNDIIGTTLMYQVRSQELFRKNSTIFSDFSVRIGIAEGKSESMEINLNIES